VSRRGPFTGTSADSLILAQAPLGARLAHDCLARARGEVRDMAALAAPADLPLGPRSAAGLHAGQGRVVTSAVRAHEPPH
jgi:hypothetical protein